MLTAKVVDSFDELRARARLFTARRIAVAGSDNPVALAAAAEAAKERLAQVVYLGDPLRTQFRLAALGHTQPFHNAEVLAAVDPANAAIELATRGEVDAVLDAGRRIGPLLTGLRGAGGPGTPSGLLFYEDALAGARRLVAVTDIGVHVAPDLKQRIAIVRNAIAALRALGVARPRVALLSATDTVAGRVPLPVHERRLAEYAAAGRFGEASVAPPVTLETALMFRGVPGPGQDAGPADVLVVPTLEAGNLFARAVKWIARRPAAHVVAGLAVPLVTPGPADGVDDVLSGLALAVNLRTVTG